MLAKIAEFWPQNGFLIKNLLPEKSLIMISAHLWKRLATPVLDYSLAYMYNVILEVQIEWNDLTVFISNKRFPIE
jgi:hypothetical protein